MTKNTQLSQTEFLNALSNTNKYLTIIDFCKQQIGKNNYILSDSENYAKIFSDFENLKNEYFENEVLNLKSYSDFENYCNKTAQIYINLQTELHSNILDEKQQKNVFQKNFIKAYNKQIAKIQLNDVNKENVENSIKIYNNLNTKTIKR